MVLRLQLEQTRQCNDAQWIMLADSRVSSKHDPLSSLALPFGPQPASNLLSL